MQIPEGSPAGLATAGRMSPASGDVPAGPARLRLPWALLAAAAGGVALAVAFPPAGLGRWPPSARPCW